jgi:hypothetical protein
VPQTNVAAEPRVSCRIHRFDGQVPALVGTVEICEEGHDHGQQAFLYCCTRPGCGFPITMPARL